MSSDQNTAGNSPVKTYESINHRAMAMAVEAVNHRANAMDPVNHRANGMDTSQTAESDSIIQDRKREQSQRMQNSSSDHPDAASWVNCQNCHRPVKTEWDSCPECRIKVDKDAHQYECDDMNGQSSPTNSCENSQEDGMSPMNRRSRTSILNRQPSLVEGPNGEFMGNRKKSFRVSFSEKIEHTRNLPEDEDASPQDTDDVTEITLPPQQPDNRVATSTCCVVM